MPPSRSADRPPGLLAAMLATLVVFLGLSVSGIALTIDGHWLLGNALLMAGLVVGLAFSWWSRRRWAEHRASSKQQR